MEMKLLGSFDQFEPELDFLMSKEDLNTDLLYLHFLINLQNLAISSYLLMSKEITTPSTVPM